MFKVEIDITKAMASFSEAAKNNDLSSAIAAISIICRKTLMTPSQVLNQIITSASNTGYQNDVDMAEELLNLLQENRNQTKSRVETIEAAITDAEYCFDEIKKSGNPAVIKNYVATIRKDLDEIEKAVSYEV